MKGDSVTNTKVGALTDAADKNLPVALDAFVLDVIMGESGSGIEYLGNNDFGIYDYPSAEEWIQTSSWPHSVYRLGDGTFHYVVFNDPQGAVEFKLRWGRQAVKYDREAHLHQRTDAR